MKGKKGFSWLLTLVALLLMMATTSLSHAVTMVTGNAGGTYTYVQATGVLTLNWTTSTFTCNGPSLGVETNQVTSITATVMTWGGDNQMTFTRSSGTPGNIVGTWTTTDPSNNSTFTVTINANSTFSVVGTVPPCNGGTVNAPFALVQVDGNVQDWASILVGLTDRSGDADYTGLDITGISMAHDADNIFFRATRSGSNLPANAYSNFWFFLRPANPGQKGYAIEFFHSTPDQRNARLYDISANPRDYNSFVLLSSSIPSFFGTNDIEFSIPKSMITVEPSFTLSFDTSHTYGDYQWQDNSDVADLDMIVQIDSSQTSATAHAAGSYSYVSGSLNLNWTSSDFPCNGPDLGVETNQVTSITATSMTWGGDNPTTFTRPSGSAGNIVGTWTSMDSSTGATYQVTFNSNGTMSLTGTLPSCGSSDNQAPSVPTGLSAWPDNQGRISLSWNASTDNVGVTYYQIFRNGQPAGEPAGQNNTFWPDLFVTPGVTYSYTVSACDGAGNCSAQSAPATATAPGGSNASASGNYSFNAGSSMLTMNWTSSNFLCVGPSVGQDILAVSTLNATTLVIEAGPAMTFTRSGGTGILGAWNTSIDGVAYQLTFNDVGGVSFDGPAPVCGGGSDSQPPTVPTGVSASANGTNQIRVSWNASIDNVDVNNYRVYRDGQQVFQLQLPQPPTAPNYAWTDFTVSSGVTYGYTVSACDAAGNCSAQSAPVQATAGLGVLATDVLQVMASTGTYEFWRQNGFYSYFRYSYDASKVSFAGSEYLYNATSQTWDLQPNESGSAATAYYLTPTGWTLLPTNSADSVSANPDGSVRISNGYGRNFDVRMYSSDLSGTSISGNAQQSGRFDNSGVYGSATFPSGSKTYRGTYTATSDYFELAAAFTPTLDTNAVESVVASYPAGGSKYLSSVDSPFALQFGAGGTVKIFSSVGLFDQNGAQVPGVTPAYFADSTWQYHTDANTGAKILMVDMARVGDWATIFALLPADGKVHGGKGYPNGYVWDELDGGGSLNRTAFNAAVAALGLPAAPNGSQVTGAIAQVQSAIAMFLGTKPVDSSCDLNNDQRVTAAEVQLVVNAFLGL